jgi:hypothetical protein
MGAIGGVFVTRRSAKNRRPLTKRRKRLHSPESEGILPLDIDFPHKGYQYRSLLCAVFS